MLGVTITGVALEIISGMFVIVTEGRDDTPIIKKWARRIFIGIGLIALIACLVMGE